MNDKNVTHQLTIEPKSGWQLINWKELIDYKDLLYFLIKNLKTLILLM